jgi:hypothetical protein
MQLEGLTIALRTRTPWEATDLGIALVRTHAWKIYSAWLLTTLPVFALTNALACWIGIPWTAALAMWWLKPVFDRVPLYVISRAVFGHVPPLRETLRAQRTSGWRALLGWLTWRRFHPGRAMLLPVDMLEGVRGTQRRERVYVLSRAYASPNMMLTLIGVNLEIMLGIALVMFGLMFVPVEFFSESAKIVWQTLIEEPPRWAQVLANGIGWLATSIVEPFYIGAGFGLYLNRRMQLEAWDIELAFRRMAARLAPPLAAAALLLVMLMTIVTPLRAAAPPSAPAAEPTAQDNGKRDDGTLDESAPEASQSDKQARNEDQPETEGAEKDQSEQDQSEKDQSEQDRFGKHRSGKVQHTTAKNLQELFADNYRTDGAAFEADVARAYKQVDLNPTAKQGFWKRRHPDDEETPSTTPQWAQVLGKSFGFLAQYGLWIVLGVLLIAIVANYKRWLSWLPDVRRAAAAPPPLELHAQQTSERLPQDIPAAVHALLGKGQVRAALALLYRAAVGRLIEQLGAPLPPGATEADCLRQVKRLHNIAYRDLFARIVRCWQTAAYAQRLPAAADVEALLVDWSAPAQSAPVETAP